MKNYFLDCSISNIKLIYKLSNTTVIEYKFNEEIFISSNIEIQCETSSLINKQ